jgi:hypothetical protein
MSFPPPNTFNGQAQENLNNYLEDLQLFLQMNAVKEELHVQVAARFLGGSARIWWNSLETKPMDLNTFREAIKKHYAFLMPEDTARQRLYCIQQAGSLESYIDSFSTTLLQAGKMEGSEQVYFFIKGLKDKSMAEKVTRKGHRTLQDAIHDARTIHQFAMMVTPQSFSAPPVNTPSDMEVDALYRPSPRSLAPLTEREREYLKKNNGCYKCRKLGHHAKDCRSGAPVNNKGTNNYSPSFLISSLAPETLFKLNLTFQPNTTLEALLASGNFLLSDCSGYIRPSG